MNRCDSEVSVDSDGCLWVLCQVDLRVWDGDSLVMVSIIRVFCQAFLSTMLFFLLVKRQGTSEMSPHSSSHGLLCPVLPSLLHYLSGHKQDRCLLSQWWGRTGKAVLALVS